MTAPGAPLSQLSPGAKIAPNDSPKAHTTRPHATLASPPRRDHRPDLATSNHRPRPAWIHTVAVAACTGWKDQIVPPALTTSCTQRGDAAAAGWTTADGRPPAICGWAWRIPSRI